MNYDQVIKAYKELQIGVCEEYLKVRTQFNKLVLPHHTDKNKSADPEKLHRVLEAFRFIKDNYSQIQQEKEAILNYEAKRQGIKHHEKQELPRQETRQEPNSYSPRANTFNSRCFYSRPTPVPHCTYEFHFNFSSHNNPAAQQEKLRQEQLRKEQEEKLRQEQLQKEQAEKLRQEQLRKEQEEELRQEQLRKEQEENLRKAQEKLSQQLKEYNNSCKQQPIKIKRIREEISQEKSHSYEYTNSGLRRTQERKHQAEPQVGEQSHLWWENYQRKQKEDLQVLRERYNARKAQRAQLRAQQQAQRKALEEKLRKEQEKASQHQGTKRAREESPPAQHKILYQFGATHIYVSQLYGNYDTEVASPKQAAKRRKKP